MVNNREWPATIVGIRMAGQDGWHVLQLPMTYETIVTLYKGEPNVLKIRKITNGVSWITCGDGKITMDSERIALAALDFDWVFDPSNGYFRAPGELLQEPSVSPVVKDVCKIVIDKPHAGWTDLHMSFGDTRISIQCSYVFDPFPDLIYFLECLLRKSGARIVVNQEGSYVGISGYAYEGCNVRVVVCKYTKPVLIAADCVVAKHIFVRQCYEALQEFVSCRELLYKQWAWDWQEDDPGYPSLRSAVIEQYLASCSNAFPSPAP